jgi:hypothetical protein
MTLERDLQRLAGGFPKTPPLAPGVAAAAQGASLRRRRRRRIAVIAIALLTGVPAAALAVSPGLREHVLETFGLRGVTIVRVARLPPVGPDARRLSLGRHVTLREAQRALKQRVQPPAALGKPDGIYADPLFLGVDISLLYEPRTVAARLGARKRVVVSMLRGTFKAQYLYKMLGGSSRVTKLRVGAQPAVLVTGQPHLVFLFLDGNETDQTHFRLAGNVLLWQRKALIVRIEGDLPAAELVRIARSIPPG